LGIGELATAGARCKGGAPRVLATFLSNLAICVFLYAMRGNFDQEEEVEENLRFHGTTFSLTADRQTVF
jgi:hypothetical protein